MLSAVLASLVLTMVPPDFNGDANVDVSDLLYLLQNWGDCQGPCPCDLASDGRVDVSDLLVLLSNWGPLDDHYASSVQVPQITTIGTGTSGLHRSSYIDATSPNSSIGVTSDAIARYAPPTVQNQRRRALLFIDATQETAGPTIPHDAYILDATLHLTTGTSPYNGECMMQLRELTCDDWDEHVSFKSCNATNDWEAAGGDFTEEHGVDFVEPGGTYQVREIDVTHILRKRWREGRRSLNVIIMPEDESGDEILGNIYRGIGDAVGSRRPKLTVRWGLFNTRVIEDTEIIDPVDPPALPESSTTTVVSHNLFYGLGIRRMSSTPGGEVTASSIGFAVNDNIERHARAILDCYSEAGLPDVLVLQEWWSHRLFGVDLLGVPQWKIFWDTYYPYRTGTNWLYPEAAADPDNVEGVDYHLYWDDSPHIDSTNHGGKDNLWQRVAYLQPGPHGHWWLPDDSQHPTGTGVGIRTQSSSGFFPSFKHDMSVVSRYPIIKAQKIELVNHHPDDRKARGVFYAAVQRDENTVLHIYNLHINRSTGSHAHIEVLYPTLAHLILDHMHDSDIDMNNEPVFICGDINIDVYDPEGYGGRGQEFFHILLDAGFINTWDPVPHEDRITFSGAVLDYIFASPGAALLTGSDIVAQLVPNSGLNGGSPGTDEGSVSDHRAVMLTLDGETRENRPASEDDEFETRCVSRR